MSKSKTPNSRKQFKSAAQEVAGRAKLVQRARMQQVAQEVQGTKAILELVLAAGGQVLASDEFGFTQEQLEKWLKLTMSRTQSLFDEIKAKTANEGKGT